MQRVKFIEATPSYGKNACVYLREEEAKAAIKTGKAIRVDDTPPAGDGPVKGIPTTRITFNAPVSGKDGHYAMGERATLPDELAQKFIKRGVAEEFPVVSADLSQPPADKMVHGSVTK